MMAVSHLSFAILVAGFLGMLSLNNVLPLVFLLLGSLLPDIDEQRSVLGRRLRPLSKLLRHRGFTHSFFFLFLLSPIILFSFSIGSALILGVLTHYAADLVTGRLRLFWPSKLRLGRKVFPYKLEFLFTALCLVASYFFMRL